MQKKRLAILGSTGSIGLQSLEVARHLGLEVVTLAAHSNIELLLSQIVEFHPKLVAVFDEKKAKELKALVPYMTVVFGEEGLQEAASHPEVDLVLSAITGFAGVAPTLAAINSGKSVALANKEVLVAAGALVMQKAKDMGVDIIPVDSEHSAVFQCLEHRKKEEMRRIILTASGGPFFHHSQKDLANVTLKQSLSHPSWKMGPKITIDSSTMMNKGLEVIEASYLFDTVWSAIDVVVHPQSVIHSMVEMQDGSCFAQMSEPSMIFPIQYAITWPHRAAGFRPPFSFIKYPKLEFFPLEKGKFICLDLAYAALQEGGSFPCFLNAANEVLVDRFLQNQIGWLDIGYKLEKLLDRHKREIALDLEGIVAVNAMARQEAQII